MLPSRIISAFDVRGDCEPGAVSHVPIASVDQLPFRRRKEALAHGVVVAIRLPAHARRDPNNATIQSNEGVRFFV